MSLFIAGKVTQEQGRRHPRRDPFKIHSPILMTSRFCQRPSVNPRRPSEDQSSRAEPSSIISLADFANTCWSILARRLREHLLEHQVQTAREMEWEQQHSSMPGTSPL